MFVRVAVAFVLCCSVAWAAERSDDPAADPVPAGHSLHGEAFNEGPRQFAQPMTGTGKIHFPTSTKVPTAQQFVDQGVGQLHGFWYLEAERSFRQAAQADPDLAIAYWGLAMANINNPSRARGMIDQAMSRRDKGADRREKLYIEALDQLLPPADAEESPSDDDDDEEEDDEASEKDPQQDAKREAKKKRQEQYLAGLEKILHEFPEDIEAKAFLAVSLWMADRDGVKLASRYAVDALLGEVFAANPQHPAHHYRIHLWDAARPENALQSAAQCGPAAPAIAHMWHMPGHIYSKLKRYSDAAWQQEASARVDHAHMIRTGLMPDQIHNFAHNNEWLVRNLLYVGRVQDALDLSRNLASLPRHPKYNTLKKGSAKFGRERLIQTLTQYSLWNELIAEAGGDYLVPTDDSMAQAEWLGWLAVAQFMTDQPAEGGKTLRSLQRRRVAVQSQLIDRAEGLAAQSDDAAEDAADAQDDAPKPDRQQLKRDAKQLQQIIARAAAAAATARHDLTALRQHLEHAKLDPLLKAEWLARAGDRKEALKLAQQEVKNGPQQVRPLAVHVDLLWHDGDKEQAQKQFETLRSVAGTADIDTPLLARLAPVAKAAGINGDWRSPSPPADDLGDRPDLDTLGPMRWQPTQSPTWAAKTSSGDLVSSEELDGRPRIVLFYLGFGCLHCVEQLHAFAPKNEAFAKAGIELMAISTESVDDLQTGLKNFDEQMVIPLMSDQDKHVFRSFGCWDDFENQPLHGTFLIDGRGRIRWQDIGHEPFTDVDFLLTESQRLLRLP